MKGLSRRQLPVIILYYLQKVNSNHSGIFKIRKYTLSKRVFVMPELDKIIYSGHQWNMLKILFPSSVLKIYCRNLEISWKSKGRKRKVLKMSALCLWIQIFPLSLPCSDGPSLFIHTSEHTHRNEMLSALAKFIMMKIYCTSKLQINVQQ